MPGLTQLKKIRIVILYYKTSIDKLLYANKLNWQKKGQVRKLALVIDLNPLCTTFHRLFLLQQPWRSCFFLFQMALPAETVIIAARLSTVGNIS